MAKRFYVGASRDVEVLLPDEYGNLVTHELCYGDEVQVSDEIAAHMDTVPDNWSTEHPGDQVALGAKQREEQDARFLADLREWIDAVEALGVTPPAPAANVQTHRCHDEEAVRKSLTARARAAGVKADKDEPLDVYVRRIEDAEAAQAFAGEPPDDASKQPTGREPKPAPKTDANEEA